jgi:hypothetical protein
MPRGGFSVGSLETETGSARQIKMKKPKSRARPRNTIAKQINAAIKAGIFDADTIAVYGQKLSYEESYLSQYYEAKDRWDLAVSKGKDSLFPWRFEADIKSDEDFKKLKMKFDDMEECISQMFMQAVNSHDVEKIINLAKAVGFFKDKRLSLDYMPADRERALLLILKSLLDRSGGKIPIRRVAQFLVLDKPEALNKIVTSEDGFSALRRKCLQLGIPLTESRKIRPK